MSLHSLINSEFHIYLHQPISPDYTLPKQIFIASSLAFNASKIITVYGGFLISVLYSAAYIVSGQWYVPMLLLLIVATISKIYFAAKHKIAWSLIDFGISTFTTLILVLSFLNLFNLDKSILEIGDKLMSGFIGVYLFLIPSILSLTLALISLLMLNTSHPKFSKALYYPLLLIAFIGGFYVSYLYADQFKYFFKLSFADTISNTILIASNIITVLIAISSKRS